MFKPENIKIGVIGLGYVGLPLAVAFAEKYAVVGYDINTQRIASLNNGTDETGEVADHDLKTVLDTSTNQLGLTLSADLELLKSSNVYIITVPTLIFENKEPDFRFLFKAAETIGSILKKNDTIIFESTVYPGATEEECVPILEQFSGLQYNKDFFVGYSPERINPGDKKNTLKSIVKLTAGSNEDTRLFVDSLYASIITAGTYSVGSIKIAEAAKVIENSQRDINIAFVNELSKVFAPMGIPTREVLEAAATKWNFLNFVPGLVGGHCIGINPYFLVHKSTALGYKPNLILDGRKINESMPSFVADQIILHLAKRRVLPQDASVLILGATFKENCPDTRNSKVKELIKSLAVYDSDISVYDPIAIGLEHTGFNIYTDINALQKLQFDSIILAVSHSEFANVKWEKYLKREGFIFDIKGFLPVSEKVIQL